MHKLAIEAVALSKAFGLEQGAVYTALKDVSFELKRGDSMAVIGRNGSGKSTLLKILAGVYKPTSGSAVIRGRVASVLDIGTGFHPDLTGYENIFFHGQVMGFKKSEILAKLDDIVSFSGIEAFINEPVKTYSNGMFVRLASSVIATLAYDVLILDEVMGAGDARFKIKFAEKLAGLVQQGTTVIMASHNVNELFECNLFMWLEDGGVKSFKNDKQVLIDYADYSLNYNRGTGKLAASNAGFAAEADLAINGLRILGIKLRNAENIECNLFEYDEAINMDMELEVVTPDSPFPFMFVIVDGLSNMPVFGTSYNFIAPDYRTGLAGEKLFLRAVLPDKILNFGHYHIDIYGFDSEARGRQLKINALSFEVKKSKSAGFALRGGRLPGLIQPEVEWKLLPVADSV